MTLCVIQARYGSTRLPGKVLLPIKGVPLISIAYNKAVDAFGEDNVVIAYPSTVENLPLAMYLAKNAMHSFGSKIPENDVLGRFHECATFYRFGDESVIFRLTPDDWRKSVEMMKRVASGEKGIPIEQGGEAFTLGELKHAHQTIHSEFKREHITLCFPNPVVLPPEDGLPWSIDTMADLEAANA
jgi:spore coat polysaccharide biosynthesis protein SpsF (cytidylyltransferase family)